MPLSSAFRPFDDDREISLKDQRRAEANREKAFARTIRHALAGHALTADDLAEWHRELLEGLSYVPDPCYLGGYRGSEHPWLRGYNVRIGATLATPAGKVLEELERFFRALARQIKNIAIIPGQAFSRDEVLRVAALAAWAHGKWIRIHPFANANGRTGRLLANWVLARFRLPPVVRVRPRPGSPYAKAAAASMNGQHDRMARWLLDLLEEEGS